MRDGRRERRGDEGREERKRGESNYMMDIAVLLQCGGLWRSQRSPVLHICTLHIDAFTWSTSWLEINLAITSQDTASHKGQAAALVKASFYHKICHSQPCFALEVSCEQALCCLVRCDRVTAVGKISWKQCTPHRMLPTMQVIAARTPCL